MVILYSTGCPKCNVLKEKLKAANIQHTEISDRELIIAQGIDAVPVLEVNGTKLSFAAANEWIKEQAK